MIDLEKAIQKTEYSTRLGTEKDYENLSKILVEVIRNISLEISCRVLSPLWTEYICQNTEPATHEQNNEDVPQQKENHVI